MTDGLLAFIVSQIVCTPIYIAAYVEAKDKRRRQEYLDEMAAKEAVIKQEERADGEKYRRILFDALRALKTAGTGAPFISEAIRSDEIDKKLALSTIRLSRKSTMKWADGSTEDARRHWEEVWKIFDETESKLKEGEGV